MCFSNREDFLALVGIGAGRTTAEYQAGVRAGPVCRAQPFWGSSSSGIASILGRAWIHRLPIVRDGTTPLLARCSTADLGTRRRHPIGYPSVAMR
jgi:hypothetical protein